MRIPYDSLTLAAVVAESRPLAGARLARILQTDALTVVLGLDSDADRWLLVSADPTYARAHLIFRRPEGAVRPPRFCAELRRLLTGARVEFVRQRGLDRILEIGLSSQTGDYQLVAEIMGKHSNVILVRSDRTVATAAKYVGLSKSRRPILAGKPYEPPPFAPKPSILQAVPGDDVRDFDGGSPFLAKLIAAGVPLEDVQAAIRDSRFGAFFSHGHGAYPMPLGTLGIPSLARPSISLALEHAFSDLVTRDQTQAKRSLLLKQLARVLLAREVALHEVRQSVEAAKNADRLQRYGQLTLAFQSRIAPGAALLEAWDFDGRAVTVPLMPDLTPLENAQRYFDKAKKAKNRAERLVLQEARLAAEVEDLSRTLSEVESTDDPDRIQSVHEEAGRRKWLALPQSSARGKPERPYDGHAIRELVSPGGWRVLFGENATANDYLTTKVARPGDLWFHVRGAPSAHVVLATNNQPSRVARADIEFAARIAASRSPSKHSGYISVDYVQRRYVRKPRGSAPGFATYTHEKTIHLET